MHFTFERRDGAVVPVAASTTGTLAPAPEVAAEEAAAEAAGARPWWRGASGTASEEGTASEAKAVPASAASLPAEPFAAELLPVGTPSKRQEVVIIRHGK
eukprot:1240571-Prymnesium_polylepis.2